MGIIKKVIDWAAREVQKSTGEEERREQVSRLKQLAIEFKQTVTTAIAALNREIEAFNKSVKDLNLFRSSKVKENIETLCLFLRKFGNCKPISVYCEESEQMPHDFPQKELDNIENYINDVDWSQDEVFLKTFLLSPIGMKLKTRQQNLSMREHINELQLQTEETIRQLEIRQFSTKQETKLCELYISNIKFISQVIVNRIIPELELVEAFFQAEKIKNEVLCGHQLANLHFNYDSNCLIDTAYAKHYQLVKNTFLFYVISCRIYNTPVLTNLLHSQTTVDDLTRLESEHALLKKQSEALNVSMFVQREV